MKLPDWIEKITIKKKCVQEHGTENKDPYWAWIITVEMEDDVRYFWVNEDEVELEGKDTIGQLIDRFIQSLVLGDQEED